MADIIQLRRDTAERWAMVNPVLKEGEMGIVTDNYNQYKVGNGIDAWNDLPLCGYNGIADGAVTTEKLADNIQSLIANISKNYVFAGIATPTTNPGTPDGPVFYLATEAGTYANFNGISVIEEEAVILQWNNGAWTKITTGFATQHDVDGRLAEVEKTKMPIDNNQSETKVSDNSDGFYFVDKNNNIIAKILSDGIHTIALYDKDGNKIGESTGTSIESIKDKAKQDGFYFTDAVGNVIAKITKDGLQAIKILDKDGNEIGGININGENGTLPIILGNKLVPTKIMSHPLYGKHIWSIGDSHRVAYMQKLADLSGAIYDHEKNITYPSGADDRYIGFNSLINQAYALIDKVKNESYIVDYIFIEDVHWFFNSTVEEVPPFLCKAMYTYTDRVFADHMEANSYFIENFSEVVSNFTPKPNAILRFQIQSIVQSPTIQLSSGETTNAGQVYIIFNNSEGIQFKAGILIDEGMTLIDAVNKINEIQFEETGSSWTNDKHHQTLIEPSIPFTYHGGVDSSDKSLLIEFDFGSTGLTISGETQITEGNISYRNYGFHSRDVSEWNTPTNNKQTDIWRYIAPEADNYKWMKALVELLNKEIPTAKLVFFSMSDDSWNFENDTITEGNTVKDLKYPDGSFNVYALCQTERHKRSEACQEGMKNVAIYYNLQHIDVMNIWGISWLNWKEYYNSNNVHPKKNGYDRVSEVLSKNVI